MKSGEANLFPHVLTCLSRPRLCRPALRRGSSRLTSPTAILTFILALAACLNGARSSAQSSSDNADAIRGVVINSVTHEPIPRALVSSPGNRFATLTNSEGRFEFTLPKPDSASGGSSPSNGPVQNQSVYSLMARKPGFLADPNAQAQSFQSNAAKDVTLTLIPEALIVGAVALPSADAPDTITLQIFRRMVHDGRGHWGLVGNTQSKSDGQFRFADLPEGTYKLLTNKLLDRDPLTADPRGPLFGYPPVFYPSAPDFESAGTIHLAAGQTQTVSLSLVKQPYYRVKVPVIVPDADASASGISVNVYAHGHKGPGFSLGYNGSDRAIEGMLPNGSYTIEASSFGPNSVTGMETITIKGGPVEGPRMTLVPNAAIRVNVREEFTSADHTGTPQWNIEGRAVAISGPRRYLNVTLEPVDDYGVGRTVTLRNPTASGDDALLIEGAPAGSYWVRVHSSRGYPASVRSGSLDLQHRPLVVGVGGGASPIEITMRDDTAEVGGTVEGITPPPQGPGSAGNAPGQGQGRAHVYCIPLPDSSGQFTEASVRPDGKFVSQRLAPGMYRVLAFDRVQTDLEYLNPEVMQIYESKGPVVRVAGGQKERVQLKLISTSAPGSDE